MAKGKKSLIETVDPDLLVETDKEEGQIPFFIIDKEYGIAADNLCYMLVYAKQAARTIEDNKVETYKKWEPIGYYSTLKMVFVGYVKTKEKRLNRKLLKSTDLQDIKNNQVTVMNLLTKALSPSGENKIIYDTVELIQTKEELLKSINEINSFKEKLINQCNELETLIKERRKIIISQTEPTKHRYKKEE